MSLRQKYLKILSGIVPAGAVGISMLLGSAAPSAAKEHPDGLQPSAAPPVSERLAAIRDAVSAVSEEAGRAGTPADRDVQLAWGNWWRNGGWGWRRWGSPNWHNWHNWPNWGNWWHNW
jgi:hypothetical protein